MGYVLKHFHTQHTHTLATRSVIFFLASDNASQTSARYVTVWTLWSGLFCLVSLHDRYLHMCLQDTPCLRAHWNEDQVQMTPQKSNCFFWRFCIICSRKVKHMRSTWDKNSSGFLSMEQSCSACSAAHCFQKESSAPTACPRRQIKPSCHLSLHKAEEVLSDLWLSL